MIPLQVVDLLSPEETEDVWSTIVDLRDSWRDLSGGNEFALGASSFLDGSANPSYLELAATSRPILEARFGWLYGKILEAVTPVFQESVALPVTYSDDLALPGFVCLLRGRRRERWTGAHVDFNVQALIEQEGQPLDLDRCASFTLPIRLPPRSSGLRTWPQIDANHVRAYAEEHSLAAHKASATLGRLWPFFELQRYTPGQLVIHSGQVLHEVEPWDPPDGDGRISLQGHAAVRNGSWEVFW